ncbi:MAG: PAS-domain containing protein [Sneathiella sp.]|nr:PAS-domain containing protein [Sneathiella sp.]
MSVYFGVYAKEQLKDRVGYYLLTTGLALTTLAAFLDFLFIGPSHFLPFQITGEVFLEGWRIFGYLPGIILILTGVTHFLSVVGKMNDKAAVQEKKEISLLAQTEDLKSAISRAETAEGILVEALEAISEAFIIFDAEDRVVAFNQQHRNLFDDVDEILQPGVTFEELIRYQAKNSRSFTDQDETERWIQKRLNAHRNPQGVKEQVFNGDQVYRLTESKTASGGTVAIRTDITDLRKREEALGLLNERFQEAQSVAHIGNWSFNVTKEKHNWSDELSRIMGYDPAVLEITSDAYHSRVHPEDLKQVRAIVKTALDNKENYQTKYRMIRPDGEIVYVREIGRCQVNEDGVVDFYRGTLQDITSEHLIGLELLDAKFRAEEGTKSKSLFLANMSHELRTPLNAVIGFAEVISKEIFGPINNEKYKEYTGNILSSGQHLLSLINDILDYSRLEAGKYEIESKDVSFRDVIEWTSLLLMPKAHEKSITLDFQFDGDFLFMGDERKFKQVMVNLVNNAIKFTPEYGNVKIYLSEKSEKYLSIYIEDDGIGIKNDDLESVLKPFVRTMNSITRSTEGTGLGLPLSKAIVELHDGVLKIKSVENEGTIVEIRLPRSRLLEARKIA